MAVQQDLCDRIIAARTFIVVQHWSKTTVILELTNQCYLQQGCALPKAAGHSDDNLDNTYVQGLI